MVQNKQKQFTTKFKNIIERDNIIKTQIPFLVAVSGGLDSTCLLSMIHDLPTIIPDQVWVVYVDHAQRKESETESLVIAKLSQNWGFHFEKHQLLLKPNASETLLRNQRYQILEQVAKKHHISIILTAHHLDDLAETYLIQILRTGSVWGVNGINRISHHNQLIFYRPLLNFSKNELLEYAQYCYLPFCEDETNFSDDTIRNRLRHHLFLNPVFSNENWSQFLNFCLNFTEIKQDVEAYYRGLIQKYLIKSSLEIKILNLRVINENPLFSLSNFLSFFLITSGVEKINHRMVNECCQLLNNNKKPQGQISLGSQQLFFKTYNNFGVKSLKTRKAIKPPFFYLNQWYYFKQGDFGIFDVAQSEDENYQKKIPIKLPESLVQLKWRHRLPGDYWYRSSGSKQKLGRFLIKHQVPNEQRDQLLVLASGSKIFYLENFGYTGLFKTDKTDKITSVVLIR